MSCSRIDDDKGPVRRLDFYPRGRDYSHQRIIDRPIELAAVDYDFGLVIENVRSNFGQVFAILIAPLPHNVQKQDATLRGVEGVFKGRREQAESRASAPWDG